MLVLCFLLLYDILFKILNAVLAFPILDLTSASIPPSTEIILHGLHDIKKANTVEIGINTAALYLI